MRSSVEDLENFAQEELHRLALGFSLGRSLSAHFCLLLDIMVSMASVKLVLENLRRVNVKLAAAGEYSMKLVLDLKCTVWTRSLRNRVPE